MARVYSGHVPSPHIHRRLAGGRPAGTGTGLASQAHPAVVKRWDEIGAEASTMTPAEFARFIQAEIDKWAPVVEASGAKPE